MAHEFERTRPCAAVAKMIPAFCMGDGYAGATLMGVVRSLGRAGIPVWALSARSDSPARFSRYCTYLPVPSAEREPEALERALLDHARLHPEKPVLFVIGDVEAQFVADRRPLLQQYFRINLPDSEIMHGLIDKRRQYCMVEHLGMPMPRTYYGVTSHTVRSGVFEFPLVIKPAVSARWPAGRLKGLLVEDASQLEHQLGELERAGAPVVVQSMIPGPASQLYTVLAYMSQCGEPVVWGTYRKVRQYPVDLGLAALAETVQVPDLEQRALRLLRDLHFTGICGMEFKKDPRDGVFRFIEMNPRFELSATLVARAGADVALAMYSDLTGSASPPQERFRAGVGWMALNLELKACRELAARGEFSWKDWARSVRGVRSEALFSWDDPMPGLAAYLRVLRNRLQMAYSRGNVTTRVLHSEDSGL